MRRSAVLLLFLASLAQALEVLNLDVDAVILHGGALAGVRDPVVVRRVSSLGDTLLWQVGESNEWLVDDQARLGVAYQWQVWRGDVQLEASDWHRKENPDLPCGRLELDVGGHPRLLLYSRGEISCGQYSEFCAATHHPAPPEQHFPRMRNYLQFFLDYPVVNVNVQDAQAFCNWQSRSHGLPAAYDKDRLQEPAAGWRLPTSRELELLAADQRHEPHLLRSGLPAAPHPRLDGQPQLGAQHVRGNVWEWCENGFGGRPLAGSAAFRTYFSPWGTEARLVYGGSYNNSIQELKDWVSVQDPTARLASLGFRVVRWFPDPAPLSGGDGITAVAPSLPRSSRP